jgi:hypothetical protein
LSEVRFNELENLKEFLRVLLLDKHLWSRAFKKSNVLDVSVHERSEVIELMLGLGLKQGEFIAKDFIQSLMKVD